MLSVVSVQANNYDATYVYRTKITFSGYDKLETLTNFPVLVRFGPNMPNFSYSQFNSPENAGDLRFLTPDFSSVLNYEIEEWNTGPGMTSYVWVRIPALTNNTSIWAYWGNLSLTNPPASTTNGAVWNANYKAVWHMGETNVHDWTAYINSGLSYTNTSITGVIGRGQNFAGNSYVDLGTKPSLNITGAITISSWLYHNTGLGWAFAYGAGIAGGNWVCDIGLSSAHQWGGEIKGFTLIGPSSPTEAMSWHHQVVVYDYDGGSVLLYHDGVQVSVTNATGASTSANLFRIGAKADLSLFWNGLIDEMRVSSAAESSNWVWACWLNQASNSVFNAYEAVEKTKRGSVMWIM